MPQPRELTDSAIDSAIHNLPEPSHPWRSHIPPEDLGAMLDSGSGQISLQACVAALHYGNRPQAIRTLQNYAQICPRRFMLSEPWSLIYGKAIVCNWLAVILIAERIGERALARSFRELVAAWAGTSALMEVNGKVLAAGARCWGHKVTGGGWDDLWAFAKGTKEPPKVGSRQYGEPGAMDDWGWLNRCARQALGELRSIAAPFLGRDWSSLVRTIPRWGARTEMQLLGYADGSRLWIMGDDESEFDDEDENGNTPGFLAAGVLGGRMVTLPPWPNPFDGKERLRQTNCKADIDGSPQFGWSLLHSHLGEKKVAGGYLTRLEPYTSAPLIFWQFCPAGSIVWEDKLSGAQPGPIPLPPVHSPEPERPKPQQKCRKWPWQVWLPKCR
jgi:hypothetical protein